MASGILKFFLPKDRVFYTLFENASANLETLANKLVLVVNEADFNKRAALVKEMEDLEHQNDLLTHNIFLELGRNFITPFDREDIHSLITSIDNVADNLHGAASRMRLYQVDKITKSIRKLTEINLEACQNIDVAVKELKKKNL